MSNSSQTGKPSSPYDVEIREGQIRLITLHPAADKNDAILVDFNYEPMNIDDDKRPYYEALSYNWGDADDYQTIHISSKSSKNRIPWRVRSNLYYALRQLRHRTNHRYLWVDALCINQDPKSREKSHQIAQMNLIYRYAVQVCVWLGVAANDSDLAMDFIPRLSDLGTFDRLVTSREESENWIALARLMMRPWFTRRWVVQEILLARKALVFCGEKSVKWSEFSTAVQLFELEMNAIVVAVKKHLDKGFLDFRGLGASILVSLTNGIFQYRVERPRPENLASIDYFIGILAPFEVSNPYDKVYALLSLVQESDRLAIDYDKFLDEVCQDVVAKSIQSTQSLDILCRPWAPTRREFDVVREQHNQKQIQKMRAWRLPTWVCQSFDVGYNSSLLCGGKRVAANPLIGNPGEPIYHASRKETARWKWKNQYNIKRLTVSGVTICKVDKIGSRAADGRVPDDWLEMAGWKDPQKKPPPDDFWRTLVANRTSDGKEPPLWYKKACQYAWHPEGKENITEFDGIPLTFSRGSTRTSEFLTRMRSVVWNRRFFITRSRPSGDPRDPRVCSGLGPSERDDQYPNGLVQKDDLICIFWGCSVPVILRQEDPNRFESNTYIIVGESYVHTAMEGDRLIDLAHGVKLREYNLR